MMTWPRAFVDSASPIMILPSHMPGRSAGHSAATPSSRARQILLATSLDAV